MLAVATRARALIKSHHGVASSITISSPTLLRQSQNVRRSSTHVVASYNVLSDHLAEPDWFTSCDPMDLAGPKRLERVKQQLDEQVDSSAIICLQEVSQNWAGDLHSYFSERGYYMITAQYGRKFNGYMGTAICFPLSKYKLLQNENIRLADALTWKPLHVAPVTKLGGPEDMGPVQSLQNMGMSERKENVQLNIRLQQHADVGTPDEFCVSTYHMPCAFRFPHVMTCHTALSVHVAASFAGKGTPFILAGDFNFEPRSDSYSLVTQGSLNDDQKGHLRVRRQAGENTSSHSAVPNEDKEEGIFEFDPNLLALDSAYAVSCGKEPEATNYAKIQASDPFIECLDYIFMSPGDWRVQSTRPLPSRKELQSSSESLPTRSEPSDHVLVAATLELNDEA